MCRRKFTRRNSLSKNRIDRALVSFQWLQDFPNLCLVGLPRGPSDHNPILLISELALDWGPKPFPFLDAWWSWPGFVKLMESFWNEIMDVNPSTSLLVKLKLLRQKLKSWNSEVFGYADINLKQICSKIDELEIAGENRILTSGEKNEFSFING